MSAWLNCGSLCSRSDQALRIKTKASSTNSTVTNITYSGNVGTGLRQFGVLIDQVNAASLTTWVKFLNLSPIPRATPTLSARPEMA